MIPKFLRRKKGYKKARLGDRRKKISTVKSIVALVTFLVFTGIVVWAVHLPQVTVSTVHIEGNSIISTLAIEDIVADQIKGSYIFLFPRANSFFLPHRSISRELKDSFLRIKEIAITKNNLSAVTITVSEREPFALWCGNTYINTEEVLSTCYFLDRDGYVFAKSPDFSGSIFLKYFGFLENGNGQGGLDPIGKYFASLEFFSELRDFIDGLSRIGDVPVSLTQNGFDIEIILEDGSSIFFSVDQELTTLFDSYQSIKESDVFTEAKKKETEIDYIDLRFGNKVFYKFR